MRNKRDAVPAFSLSCTPMVLVPLVLILMGPFLVVKAGVMPAFSRFISPSGCINSSDLHQAPVAHITTSLRKEPEQALLCLTECFP